MKKEYSPCDRIRYGTADSESSNRGEGLEMVTHKRGNGVKINFMGTNFFCHIAFLGV